jgi:hypothetical protein
MDPKFFLIFGHKRMSAGAWFYESPQVSTRAGFIAAIGWKFAENVVSLCTADGDDLVFHRLAHHFENPRAEFGEFI